LDAKQTKPVSGGKAPSRTVTAASVSGEVTKTRLKPQVSGSGAGTKLREINEHPFDQNEWEEKTIEDVFSVTLSVSRKSFEGSGAEFIQEE
jgi:hypothetical protein